MINFILGKEFIELCIRIKLSGLDCCFSRPPAIVFVGSKKGTLLLADTINKVSALLCHVMTEFS